VTVAVPGVPPGVETRVEAGVARQRGARAAVHGGRLVLDRNLKLFRNPASMAGMILFPLIFFLGFNLIMTRTLDRIGIEAAQFLMPTVVVQAMFFTAMSSAFYTAADRTSGLIGRLRTLPLHPAATILGRLGADVARSLVSIAVLVVAASILGFRFEAGPVAAVGFVLVALLFSVTLAAGFGGWVLGAADPTAVTQVMSVPYLPLLMLSTGFAPVEGFPGWLHPFVRWQPVSLTIDALRALADGGATTVALLRALAVLAVLLTVFVVLASRAFRRVS